MASAHVHRNRRCPQAPETPPGRSLREYRLQFLLRFPDIPGARSRLSACGRYPEGHLSKIGTQHRYRKGVYHLYKDFDCPVVPVASNLGQRWNQEDWKKCPGPAAMEFLPPIMPGLDKEAFMAQLEEMIETRSIALLDLENLGHLNPDDIGKTVENDSARTKREAREAQESNT